MDRWDYTLISPLSIKRPRARDYPLNLNHFRNAHFQTLNSMKKKYKELMSPQILDLPILEKISIHYVLYPKTKRLCDVSNICSVADKFFSDALVELGRLPDDNYQHLGKVSFSFGEIDKENPRIEIRITNENHTIE